MKIIDRYNNNYDAIVFLNGDLPSKQITDRFVSKKILAADGASSHLFRNNIVPDIIIGDLDSINIDLIASDFDRNKIIQDTNQENTDFEKILIYCIGHDINRILVLGIHGGEIDHTLNNLSIIKKFNKRLDLWIFDSDKYGFLADESFKISAKTNEMISLIPFPAARITTGNLKWNLNNEILELGIRDGARNRATNDEVTVDIHDGSLFCFVSAFD